MKQQWKMFADLKSRNCGGDWFELFVNFSAGGGIRLDVSGVHLRRFAPHEQQNTCFCPFSMAEAPAMPEPAATSAATCPEVAVSRPARLRCRRTVWWDEEVVGRFAME